MEILTIASYVITGLSLLFSFVSVIIAIVKWLKSGKLSKITALRDMIPDLVVKAEQIFGKGKGISKMDYVMTQLRLFALSNNIKYKEDKLKADVEAVVSATNQVNIDKPFPVLPTKAASVPDNDKADAGEQMDTENNKYF